MRKEKPVFANVLGLRPVGDLRLRFLAEAAQEWFERKEFDRAAAICEGLILLAPNAPVGYLGLAEVELAQGRYRGAEAAAKRAIRAPHTDRLTMAYGYKLAGLALLSLGRRHEAADAWRVVCDLDPDGEGASVEGAMS